MNTAARNYSATEAEMLAFLWATKYFRCYLYGKRFVVTTDHSALSYMRNYADNISHLLKWSRKLSELDFVGEHRPGPKIGHAAALSRNVGTDTLANTLGKESIRREQDKDDFCIEGNRGTISGKCEIFGTMWVSYILVARIGS